MRKNFEDISYFLTLTFAWFVITLQVIGLVFKFLNYIK